MAKIDMLQLAFAMAMGAYFITLMPSIRRASSGQEIWEQVRIPLWLILGFSALVIHFKNKAAAAAAATAAESASAKAAAAAASATASAAPSKSTKSNATSAVSDCGEGDACCGGGDCGSVDKKSKGKRGDSEGCCGGSGAESGGDCCKSGPTAKTGTAASSALKLSKTVPLFPIKLQRPYRLRIFYATTKGTAKAFAEKVAVDARNRKMECELIDLQSYDPDDLAGEDDAICLFLISTYEGGTPPASGKWFTTWLADSSNDFRVERKLLKNVHYAVFGLGDSLYGDNFIKVARNIDTWMAALCGRRIMPVGAGDQNVAESEHGSQEHDFVAWKGLLWKHLDASSPQAAQQELAAADKVEVEYHSSDDDANADEVGSEGEEMVDMEELGTVASKIKASKANRSAETAAFAGAAVAVGEAAAPREPRPMVTESLQKNLSKQGYRVIGTHSGVKLCRWTKSMLRGRGGCYKHTFYGIESHRCMETTPSLACANKCVFCWRHHTNPVGTSWRWKMDSPELIIDGAMENHYDMIRQFKGVPGVQGERFKEANQIKHCALSLVGEPIMYPEINRFLEILHQRHISSFLVTNAQFPDEMRSLRPVCQLYVSVDASNKESLKQIDRPLFKDYWPRFIQSLQALSEKGQRTVYRLTLVKSWNVDELNGYVDLIKIGKPEFVEVKGVTYCGESKASTITMQNVPWNEEVASFVRDLANKMPDYELMSEHEHSNCFLIAHKKFKVDGRWHTWIDYDRFHDLVAAGQPFTSMDYLAPTPEWAVMGHAARGFDPQETRFHRRAKPSTDPEKKIDLSGC
eukprot:m.139375 g.139375  ORF g.139375 m.139375 type:complete len:805 (-) comp16653_c4_seq1:262-2676(-)